MQLKSATLVNDMVRRLEDKMAVDVVVIDLAGRSPFTDFFVIASGNSGTHVSALAKVLDVFAHEHKLRVRGIEGLMDSTWILVDMGDVLVHLFRSETRAFYNLEKLWSPQSRVAVEEQTVALSTE